MLDHGGLALVRTKPLPDECLTSWLMRTVRANGARRHFFCSQLWPSFDPWLRDIDLTFYPTVVETMATLTNVSDHRAGGTTLWEYDGTLFSANSQSSRRRWILRFANHCWGRPHPWLQFCPLCLSSDDDPYFRRLWRMAFITYCPRHGTELLERCPTCCEPIAFHLVDDLRVPLSTCWRCRSPLLVNPPRMADADTVWLQQSMLGWLAEGYGAFGSYGMVHASLAFDIVRIVLTYLVSGAGAADVRRATATRFGGEATDFENSDHQAELEYLTINDRRRLFQLASPLFENWPHNLIDIFAECGAWHSGFRRDHSAVPFALWDPIRWQLYKPHYRPSPIEKEARDRFLVSRGYRPSRRALSRYLLAIGSG